MKDLRNTQGLLAFREIGGIGRKRRQEVLEAMGADEGTIFFEMLIKALEMRYISPLMPIGESITAWEKAEKIMQVCQENAIKITTIF
ncbi:MAG: hypothetical protein Q4C55_07040, partial [Eubacterium sp.]|nr:hypothetical protein [Eubacterium sp.]